MALSTSIFDPRWIYHHRQTVNSAGLGRIKIERITGEAKYDYATGEYSGTDTLQVYLGRARIQKVAFPTTRDFVQDEAKFQRMRVAVGFEDNELDSGVPFEIHVNDRITVLANESDPVKVGSIYYVHGTESSSNAWQRVMTAQTNMKQVAV